MPASVQPRPSVRGGERRGFVSRLRDRLRTAIGGAEPSPREALPSLPLALRQPIYRHTAAYGHFGRSDLDLPWERIDRADALRDASGVRGEARLAT